MYSLVRSQIATADTLQNVSNVNRERSRLAAASSICDLTKHNGLVTIPMYHLAMHAGQRWNVPLQ